MNCHVVDYYQHLQTIALNPRRKIIAQDTWLLEWHDCLRNSGIKLSARAMKLEMIVFNRMRTIK